MGWAALESPPAGAYSYAAGRLLGRDRELVGVARALACSRLVTLTGAPGIGKTRLAFAAGADHHAPAVAVELASVSDGSLIPSALASALSAREAAGCGLMDAVMAALRGRRLLLVLDNCEHLRDACAPAVAELLAGCPDVGVLATSREPLGVDGELVWQVPPLAVPGPDEHDRPDAMLAYPAVALFVERAREVHPGFPLSGRLAHDVATICRRLDGIPLAIELAAARVQTMTAREISRRLEDHLGLLGDREPAPGPRHRTLASALDWSYELLDDREREVLRGLSVFAGTFELEGAAAVCGHGAEVALEVGEVLDRLVLKSLVVAQADGDRPGRYRLLETIRAHAAEKLDRSGEAAVLRTAHARFYLALAERAEPELTGPRQQLWLERLEAERANLRAAIEWSLSHGLTDVGLRLAGALVLFWRVRCHFSEGRDLLEAALSAGEPATPLVARALWGAGFLRYMAGDVAGALPSLDRSLDCFRRLRDPRGCARALLIIANAYQVRNDTRVLAWLEESAALARAEGDHWCLAHALGIAGFEHLRQEQLRLARPVLEECLAVARESGDMQSLCVGLLGLGQLAVIQGDYGAAGSLLDEAARVTGALGEHFGKATALRYQGTLAFGRGDHVRARALLEESLALLPDAAPTGARLASLLALARVEHARGATREARRLVCEVLAQGGHGAVVEQALAELAVADGDRDEARRRFEDAAAQSRAESRNGQQAKALHGLGQLALDDGDVDGATDLHRRALAFHGQTGELPAIAGSLEAVAGVLAAAGHHRQAARLLGAAEALRRRGGYARASWEAPSCRRLRSSLAEALPAAEYRRALAEGEALPLEQAQAEAADGPPPARGTNGRSLTRREQEVAGLVAEGLTNPEIAARLVISLETVKTHVSHILAKLGMQGRWELAHAMRSGNGQRH
jgi:predicted ATPase/DNA-binding CsgD family transcriptional regulator